MEATREGRAYTTMIEYMMQICVNWIADDRWTRVREAAFPMHTTVTLTHRHSHTHTHIYIYIYTEMERTHNTWTIGEKQRDQRGLSTQRTPLHYIADHYSLHVRRSFMLVCCRVLFVPGILHYHSEAIALNFINFHTEYDVIYPFGQIIQNGE